MSLLELSALNVASGSARAPSVDSSLGPEVWPQPDFDASTGLALSGTAAVAAGSLLVPTNSGCTGTLNGADPMVLAQVWRLTVVVLAVVNTGAVFRLGCSSGGANGTALSPMIAAPGTYSYDVTITTLTGQFARVATMAGSSITLDSMSLRRVG